MLNRAAKLFLSARISRFKKIVLGQHAEAVLVRTGNGELLVPLEDNAVGRKLGRGGQYSSEELARLFQYLRPDDEVLVVGSHIGSLAIPLSKRCRCLTAIEANPDTYRLLSLNLGINQCVNAKAFNIAASDKTETLSFLLNRDNSGG